MQKQRLKKFAKYVVAMNIEEYVINTYLTNKKDSASLAESLKLMAGATRLVEDPACLRGTSDLPACQQTRRDVLSIVHIKEATFLGCPFLFSGGSDETCRRSRMSAGNERSSRPSADEAGCSR
jgi:hypothetical protein